MPLVSIVIPVYNVEKYILRCITSIQQQSLTDIEVIVVNDSTRDHSMSIVGDLANKDQRIKMINLERNEGPMVAREKGYMAAGGDYITFCDGDDCLPPTAIEKLYHAAVESDSDIVCGNHLYITATGEKVKHNNRLQYGNNTESVLKSLLRHELFHTLWGKLFKAALLQNYKYESFMNMTNGEDACLFYQVVTNMNKLGLINDIVYYYMYNMKSSTQVRLNKNAINNICVSNKVVEKVVSHYPELKIDLNRGIINSLCRLYVQGYNNETTCLSKQISENGLKQYMTFSYIVKYLNFHELTKLTIQYLFMFLRFKK